MLDKVTLKKDNFFTYEPPQGPAVLVLNPPYGERLDKDPDIIGLYKEIGDTLKHNYGGYKAFMISANLEAAKFVGLKPSRKIILYNGALEARLFKYEIYEGSKKAKFQNLES